MKYNSRAWLSPNSHSSGYIHCYYDPSCPNPETSHFIRIADCGRVFQLYRTSRQIKRMIENTGTLIKSLSRKDFLYRISDAGVRTYTFLLQEEFLENSFYGSFSVQSIIKTQFSKKTSSVIRLHADPQTCSPEEWEEKKRILLQELLMFQEFLRGLKPTTK